MRLIDKIREGIEDFQLNRQFKAGAASEGEPHTMPPPQDTQRMFMDMIQGMPSETTNAHEAIDAKIMENDLYNLTSPSSGGGGGGGAGGDEQQWKGGLGLLDLFSVAGGGYAGYRGAKALLPMLKNLFGKKAVSKRSFPGPGPMQSEIDAIQRILSSPAYLRRGMKLPAPESKGFRKTGITKGTATPNDPLFEAMKKFDTQGNIIPRQRMLEFLENNPAGKRFR